MPAKPVSALRTLCLAACFAAVAFLGFVAGGLSVLGGTYPGHVIENAYRAGKALRDKLTLYDEAFQLDFWRVARTEARGVTVHDASKAFNGFTLYTSGHAQKAFLVDMEGRVVHDWGVPYSAIWDKSAAVRRPQADAHVYIEKAVLYPNGDLLAVYVGVGDTPWGYGLVKMDKHSRVIWKYLAHAHHDVDVADDGTLYLLTNEIGKDAVAGFPNLRPPRIDDHVVVLSAEGRELRKVRILDAMLRSPYARLLDTAPWYTQASGDYLHANAIDVLDGTRAQKLPQATAGRVLLSFREIGTIAILDLEQEEIVWAARGPWLQQHDPDLLANGNILLFDNQGHVGPGGVTRVIELDPTTRRIAWSYAGTPEQPFVSEVRSSQERLPNGNTLITEADGGRLFEVTAEGEIVWNYVNPVRGGANQELIPIVAWGQRIDPATLSPSFLGDRAAN